MRLSPLVAASVAVIALAMSAGEGHPLLVWNMTASVPTGLYRIVGHTPHRGSLATIRLPEPYRTFAHLRGYVPASVPVIKPIAALHGDTLCRHGNVVLINNRLVALARKVDEVGRPLPRWRGCRQLGAKAVAVISSRPESFDSRYFGPVDHSYIVGLAIPIWTGTRRSTARH